MHWLQAGFSLLTILVDGDGSRLVMTISPTPFAQRLPATTSGGLAHSHVFLHPHPFRACAHSTTAGSGLLASRRVAANVGIVACQRLSVTMVAPNGVKDERRSW